MKLHKVDNKKRRLRKKLYLGEFSVLCFHIDCKLNSVAEDAFDTFTNELLDAVEQQDLCLGGGGAFGSFFACVFPQQRYASATEHDVQAIKDWLQARSDVAEFKVGDLHDSNALYQSMH